MQSHCETCPDHKEAVKRIVHFSDLLTYARELEAEVERLKEKELEGSKHCQKHYRYMKGKADLAAELAGALEAIVAVDDVDKSRKPMISNQGQAMNGYTKLANYDLTMTTARAALDKYHASGVAGHEATGGDSDV